MSIRQRLRSSLWRVPVEQEVRDELAHHRELRAQELTDRGWSPADARAEATRRIAGMEATLVKIGGNRNRHFARRERFDELRQDVAFAFRQMRLRPGFSIAAVLTLALGLGATTAIFSVVHAVILKPYAFADPDRVLVAFSLYKGSYSSWSVGNFDYFRQRLTTLDQFAAGRSTNLNLADEGRPERVIGRMVTWNYFPLFGMAPALGRTFTPDEDRPGQNNVVVLSDRLWRRRFAADPALVGRSIRLNGRSVDVVGIMPPEFEQIGDTGEAWLPIGFTAEQLVMYDEFYLEAYGRQKDGVSRAQVDDEFTRVAQALAHDQPAMNRDRGAAVRLLNEYLVGDYRLRLLVLFAAVTLVLIIACGNVANLMLARLAARSRELAIRAAIGAGRGRIVRQVLTESVVLSLLGGVAGLLVAWWALPALIAMAPDGVPRLRTATLNGTALAAAGGLVVFSAMIVGLLPAWQTTRRGTFSADLGDGKGASHGSIRPWMRQALIGGQAALAMIVLSGAALLIRSSINLHQVPIGIDTTGVLTARVALPGAQYGSPESAREAFRQVLVGVQASRSVAHAALDSGAPLADRSGSNGLVPEGRPFTSDRINSDSHFVTPDYLATLRIPLRSGRSFADTDTRQAPLVMIINETLARAAYPGVDPIGKRMVCCEGSPQNPMWKTVVGVVADIKARGPAQPARPEFYIPLAQVPDVAWTWIGRSLSIVARGDDTAAMTTAIRDAVGAVDRTVPVFSVRTLDESLNRTMAQAQFNTFLMTLLAITALVLAALGIYSVIAWLVSQRAREIGVRLALGATTRDVVVMMSGHGLKPVVAGLVAGFAGALATTSLLQNQLFEVGPRDPIALAGTAALLLVVAGAAATIPAWRATTIDPSTALRD